MVDIKQYKTSLINDLYDLSVNCNISIEELADDICEDCNAFYNQALEDLYVAFDRWVKLENKGKQCYFYTEFLRAIMNIKDELVK